MFTCFPPGAERFGFLPLELGHLADGAESTGLGAWECKELSFLSWLALDVVYLTYIS